MSQSELFGQRDYLVQRFTSRVDLGPCIVGRVLDLMVLRGYADMGRIACVSAPDYYYQQRNDEGVQRAINEKHARASYRYMTEARPGADGLLMPRMVPEVLLNARCLDALEFYDLGDPEVTYEVHSTTSDIDGIPRVVGVRVLLDHLAFPKPSSKNPESRPEISRVDGNHRLWGADEQLENDRESDDEPDEMPEIGFCLMVGLEPLQEASVFRDINGTPLKVNTAYIQRMINTIMRKRDWDEVRADLEKDRNMLAQWLAYELSTEGHAFEALVDLGGYGGLDSAGRRLPVKLPMLTSAVGQTLSSAEVMAQKWAAEPEAMLALLDEFWMAVWMSFPEAKADKRNYILLQTIGFNAMAKLGGWLIDNKGCYRQQDFEPYLRVLHDKLSLAKSGYEGLAGIAGTKVVYERMLQIVTDDEDVEWLKRKTLLLGEPTVSRALGLEGGV